MNPIFQRLLLAGPVHSLALLAAVHASSRSARADDIPTHELTGATNSSLSFFGGSTSIGLGLGYRYMIYPYAGLQVGLDTDLTYLSANDTSTTNWANVLGLRLNFGTDPKLLNRFFLDAGLGFSFRRGSVGNTSSSTTSFLYEGGLGKRFALGDTVAYVPRVVVRKVEDQSVRLTLTPIAFSIFFG